MAPLGPPCCPHPFHTGPRPSTFELQAPPRRVAKSREPRVTPHVAKSREPRVTPARRQVK
eukprot:3264741-Prymnesium_polylepis.2